MRELETYREHLQDVTEFFGAKRLLTVSDVCRYTGLTDHRTIRRHFPFNGKYISALNLARTMSKGECES